MPKNWPSWVDSHMEEYLPRVRAYDPFPYAQPGDTSGYVTLHENDYLRLSRHPEVLKARRKVDLKSGGSLMASMVFGGDSGEHGEFQSEIAACMRSEDALLTTAGWTANVGIIEALARPDMPIYLDFNVHGSLWDGGRLSQGKLIAVRHNDAKKLQHRIQKFGPGIVCIDGVYSGDGSVPDLEHYVRVCEEGNCLLILDEAHSFGMMGDRGGGLAVHLGLEDRIPLRTVSMSKALGQNGGFITGAKDLIWYLTYRMRSIIFSSSPSPGNSAAGLASLRILQREPERAQHCQEMGTLFRNLLIERGVDPGESKSQIVSLMFDNDPVGAKFYGLMRKKGILVSIFTVPAVPKDTSLARFSIHCHVTPEQMEKTANATAESLKELGINMRVKNSIVVL
jgi:CAI-1 autoinducer synthase